MFDFPITSRCVVPAPTCVINLKRLLFVRCQSFTEIPFPFALGSKLLENEGLFQFPALGMISDLAGISPTGKAGLEEKTPNEPY